MDGGEPKMWGSWSRNRKENFLEAMRDLPGKPTKVCDRIFRVSQTVRSDVFDKSLLLRSKYSLREETGVSPDGPLPDAVKGGTRWGDEIVGESACGAEKPWVRQ